MTTRYVGAGGNDSNDGLSWANRKLTLNGVEDTPVEAGDTVYVGPGTYRELLTCDVDGTSGAGVITYIGDYDGTHTTGTKGVVRITGSDDDQTITRARCIALNKDYRTFKGFTMDMVSAEAILLAASTTNTIIEQCYIDSIGDGIDLGNTGYPATIRNCFIRAKICVTALDVGTIRENTGTVIENCILFAATESHCVLLNRQCAVTIRNCLLLGFRGVHQQIDISAYQPVTVNNCIFFGNEIGIQAAAVGSVVEDYNTFYGVDTARTNTAAGAHSLTYPPLLDTRWLFEMVAGGSILSPFDLASYSQLINVAGTSPTTADMRGTTVQGTQREWGALEYDSTLDIEAGSGTGTSSVKILPFTGKVGL